MIINDGGSLSPTTGPVQTITSPQEMRVNPTIDEERPENPPE